MFDERQRHNRYQRRIFKTSVEFFRQPIPEDVQRRTEHIVATARLSPNDRVLDVGTGIGVLIPYIERYGVRYIVGCDLSPEMLAEARKCYPHVLFWCGDVIDLPRELGPFDVVFFNAVFGNVWNQRDTLQTTSTHLTPAARIIISHPMGASFTVQLRREDPQLVPHPLPKEKLLAELIESLPLRVQHFQDEERLYLCVLQHLAALSNLGDRSEGGPV